MVYEPKHLHKMSPMWLFPALVDLDRYFGSARWDYWSSTLLDVEVRPIPQIQFAGQPDRAAAKHISEMLDYARRFGERPSTILTAFVVWLLHAFGDVEFKQYATPDQIPHLRMRPEVFDFWYENFQLHYLIQHPADYLAHFAQGGENKGYNPYSGAGFFATPMALCQMMVQMTVAGADDPIALARQSVCDPCCGTGSLLLAASNYSLNLYGTDIQLDMVRMTRLNGWLYAPWMVFWPDFSFAGWPVERLKARLFGGDVPGLTPDPEQVPPVPAPINIVRGTMQQTKTGQIILPLFELEES